MAKMKDGVAYARTCDAIEDYAIDAFRVAVDLAEKRLGIELDQAIELVKVGALCSIAESCITNGEGYLDNIAKEVAEWQKH